MLFDEMEKKLKAEFPKCYVHLELYPSGGRIMITGSEECGGDPHMLESKSWRYSGGGDLDFNKSMPKSLDECVELIKGK